MFGLDMPLMITLKFSSYVTMYSITCTCYDLPTWNRYEISPSVLPTSSDEP
jgi:hypothetical protein